MPWKWRSRLRFNVWNGWRPSRRWSRPGPPSLQIGIEPLMDVIGPDAVFGDRRLLGSPITRQASRCLLLRPIHLTHERLVAGVRFESRKAWIACDPPQCGIPLYVGAV